MKNDHMFSSEEMQLVTFVLGRKTSHRHHECTGNHPDTVNYCRTTGTAYVEGVTNLRGRFCGTGYSHKIRHGAGPARYF